MGVIEASDRAWKVVQMKGEKQGVSAWLRGSSASAVSAVREVVLL